MSQEVEAEGSVQFAVFSVQLAASLEMPQRNLVIPKIQKAAGVYCQIKLNPAEKLVYLIIFLVTTTPSIDVICTKST